MNKKEIIEKIVELEIWALDRYCDFNNISVSEYINADVMGLLKYQEYVDLYKEMYGECFECGQNPCDEDCPYQVMKESEEQTNE